MVVLARAKCPKCLGTWIPRVEDPVKCPICQVPLKNRKKAGTRLPRTAPATAPCEGRAL